jgi:uncharacterized protein
MMQEWRSRKEKTRIQSLRVIGKHMAPSESMRTPRFIADAMLGRLAHWLRVLGYDTVYDAFATDADIVQQAHRENRIVLTRDQSLPQEWHLDYCLLVEDTSPMSQLRQVVQHFDLPWQTHWFKRCTICNTQLDPVAREDVVHEVSSYVFEHHQTFVRCPACRRIYWSGTHVDHMQDQLRQVLA